MSDDELMIAIYKKVCSMDEKIDSLDQRLTRVEAAIDSLDQRLTRVETTLENDVRRNIQLLAENHSTIIDKVNDAVPLLDKQRVYDVQINYLIGKVASLENDMAEVKKHIA